MLLYVTESKPPEDKFQISLNDIIEDILKYKPFKCSFCSRRFSILNTLRSHIESHYAEKLFQCHVCRKGYDDRSLFLRHLVTHFNTPFECEKCHATFKDSTNFETHLSDTEHYENVASSYKTAVSQSTDNSSASKTEETYEEPTLSDDSNDHEDDDQRSSPKTCGKDPGRSLHSWEYLPPIYTTPLQQNHEDNVKTHADVSTDANSQLKNGKNTLKSRLRGIKNEISPKTYGNADVSEEKLKNKLKSCLRASKLKIFDNLSIVNEMFTCDTCKRSFSTRSSLKRHLRINTGVKPLPRAKKIVCNECGKLFADFSHFRRHIITHTGERQFSCFCGKSFGDKNYLAKHVRCNHGSESAQPKKCCNIRRHVCEYCGKAFAIRRTLTMHIRVHTGERPFECIKCNAHFTQRSAMIRHVKNIHEKFGKSDNVCLQCGETFSGRRNLMSHMLAHKFIKRKKDGGDKIKKHMCEFCGKVFALKSILTVHKRVHTGEKPFTCFCGKEFAQSSALYIHMRKLHGRGGGYCKERSIIEKRHICEHCGKAFELKGNLHVHIRTHTGEKPYQCSLCYKLFSQNSSLRTHIRRMHGKDPKNVDKSFSCDICSASFVHYAALKTHMLLHIGMRPFNCDFCGENFAIQSALKRHIKQSHLGNLTKNV